MNKQYRFKIAFLALFILGAAKLYAQGVALEWATHAKSINSGYGTNVTVDKDGNVYSTGFFSGKTDFDPGPDSFFLTPASVTAGTFTVYNANVFIQKLDKDGNLVWVKELRSNAVSSNNIEGWSITVDEQGYVYVGGTFIGGANVNFDFDPGPDTFNLTTYGSYIGRAFILKLDSQGNFVWVKSIEGTGYSQIRDITIDKDNRIYATGYFRDTINIETHTLISGAGTIGNNAALIGNPYILKLDEGGNVHWIKPFIITGERCSGYGYGITTDENNNVYVTGYYTADSADFDPGPNVFNMPAPIGENLFAAKLDSSGNFKWAKNIQPMPGYLIATVRGKDITYDHHGGICISGDFTIGADFDPDTSATATHYMYTTSQVVEAFILKLDTTGTFVWAKHLEAQSMDPNGIATDRVGNIYTIGSFRKYTNTSLIVDFDPGPDTFSMGNANARSDLYIAKLDKDGNFGWAKHLENLSGRNNYTYDSYGFGIAVDNSGSVYSTGRFVGIVNFDPNEDTVTLESGYNPTGWSAGHAGNIFVHKMICTDTNSYVLIDTACNSYILNNEQYTESGTYTQKLVNMSGCDSTLVLNLTLYHIDVEITVDSFNLSTTQPYASYQWLLNGVVIPGATESTYTVSANGDYQVVVTNENGCTDTSDIYPITNVSINDINDIGRYIVVYPNPANDVVRIKSPITLDAVLTGIDGRDMLKVNNAKFIHVKSLADGIYYLRLIDQEGRLIKVEKMVKH